MAKRRDDQAPYWRQLRTAERSIIEYALGHGRSVINTANLLGVSPNYLRLRIQRLGIPLPTRPGLRPGPKPGFRLKKTESTEALEADNGVAEEAWEETEALDEHNEEAEEEWEASEDDDADEWNEDDDDDDDDEWDEEFDDGDSDDSDDDGSDNDDDDDDDDNDDDDSGDDSSGDDSDDNDDDAPKNAKTEAESGPTTTD